MEPNGLLSPIVVTRETDAACALIRGAGEMAERIRTLNWNESQLGPCDRWPSELLTIVNLMLASREIMTVFWGPDHLMIYNDRYTTQLGDRHPALGKPLREVWPDVVEQVTPYIDPAFSDGKSSYLDDSPLTVFENGQQTERFYSATFEPIWVRHGASMIVGGVFQTGINNTAKIRAQRALEASEMQAREAQREADRARQALQSTHEKLQLAMEFAGQGSFTYDATTNLLSADAVVQELFELEQAAGPPESWIAKVHEDDRQRVADDFAAAVSGAKPYNIEHRVVQADGIRWIQARAKLLSQPGEPALLIGISEDITLRKNVEEVLKSTAERLNLAQATGHIASWDWNLETGRILWNESEWCWGRPPEELAAAEECFKFVHPDDVTSLREALEPALQGRAEYQSEFRVMWPDGSYHWVQGKGQSVSFRAEGIPTRLVGVNQDITERKLAEAALLQSEKLAAVGRLASSIAHEINNPLEAVTNLIFLANSTSEVPMEAQGYLSLADRELRRASKIVSQTLRFHKQATGPTICSGKMLFQEILSVYQGRLVNSHIQVDERYRDEVGVECLEGEIRQVVSNLIANAIDAMPNGGRLFLRSRKAKQGSGEQGLELIVADTGSGMPAAVQRRVFEAFYSTKGIGGTGLGLWVSKEIVDRHGGTLRMRSSQANGASGTVFALFLPASQQS